MKGTLIKLLENITLSSIVRILSKVSDAIICMFSFLDKKQNIKNQAKQEKAIEKKNDKIDKIVDKGSLDDLLDL